LQERYDLAREEAARQAWVFRARNSGIDHNRNSFGPLSATVLVAAACPCSALDMKSTRALR